MTDWANLPDDYADWLAAAEEDLADVEAAGHRALKVVIDPREFPHWCKARNLAADERARIRFANFTAFHKAGYV